MKTPQEIIKNLLDLHCNPDKFDALEGVDILDNAKEYLAEPQAEPTEAEIERVAKVIYEETKHWGHEHISIELAKPIAKAAIKAVRGKL